MFDREASAAQRLKEISLKTNYGGDWRENSSQRTPHLRNRNHYQEPIRCEDHITLNKLILKRQQDEHLKLSRRDSKQNLIHRMEYPLLSGEAETEALLLSKLLCDQMQTDPYSIITIKNQHDGSSKAHSELIMAKLRRRELETQTVLRERIQYQPKGQLLPSIPIKRIANQAKATSPLKNHQIQTKMKGHSRRLSMPCLQHYIQKQSIIL